MVPLRLLLICLVCAVLSGVGPGATAQNPWSAIATVGYSRGLGEIGGNGSVGAVAGAFRRLPGGGGFRVGAELGHHRLGTSTTVIPNFNNQPGATYTEDYSWAIWQVAAAARWQPPGAGVRPHVVVGLGAYIARTRDVIVVRDAAGNRIPFYDFFETRSEAKPGFNLGAGLMFPGRVGPLSIGLEARWHGILGVGPGSVGVSDLFAVGVAAGLD